MYRITVDEIDQLSEIISGVRDAAFSHVDAAQLCDKGMCILRDVSTRPEPVWLSVSDAAALVSVSPATIRLWCRSGGVMGARQSGAGRWLIPREALLARLASYNPAMIRR